MVFKDVGSNEYVVKGAYGDAGYSLGREELEGVMFFPDDEFEISFEDYACGEMAHLKYDFFAKEQWNYDSKFGEE